MKTTFSHDQYEMCYPPGVEHHWWTVARNRLLAKLLHNETSMNSVFLEVGCGRGLVVESLRKHGLNVVGAELAEVDPVESIRTFVHTGVDANDWSEQRRSEITGILLLDVIEHVPEPEPFLQKLQSSFPNLSTVVVTVPTCNELWSNFDDFYGHYRRYSLKMLERLAADLKWKTKESSYFFRIPYIPMRLMSALGVQRNLAIKAPGKMMKPLHQVISKASELERALLPRTLKGTSAYAVFDVTAR